MIRNMWAARLAFSTFHRRFLHERSVCAARRRDSGVFVCDRHSRAPVFTNRVAEKWDETPASVVGMNPGVFKPVRDGPQICPDSKCLFIHVSVEEVYGAKAIIICWKFSFVLM